jgi:murein DD-endopeptidase MepM/ murein hydrolase activator NlpD
VLVAAAVTGLGVALAAEATPDASASGQAVLVTVPGAPGGASPALSAPPAGEASGAFAYPEDGSVVRVGATTLGATAQPGASAGAQARVELLGVSLFGGEVTVDKVEVRAGAAAGPGGASTDASAASVTGLAVLGVPVAAGAGQTPVADWGVLDIATVAGATGGTKRRAAESTVVGLRLRLLAEHAGLPAGSEIIVGRAFARVVAEAAAIPGATPLPKPKPKPAARPKPAPGAPREPGRSIPGAPPQLVRPAPDVVARLTQSGFVFPVFGPAAYGDSFGAFRGDVQGKWHHGEDIVAPLGTPLLAVTDGTLFSVGWNDIGGWRLWLRDRDGNEFYFAHLSAYSSLARDGQRVMAGDVLGFVGTSGDAEGGVPHLHFEIHPVGLLGLGYDGVVAPYPFLVAWQRSQDVDFGTGRRFVVGASAGLPVAALRAGAVLLEASDISGTSGLVPGALDDAVADER